MQVEPLASNRSINSSPILIGGKEACMETDAGKFMAVGRCGLSSDCLCFLSLYFRENIAEEVLEV